MIVPVWRGNRQRDKEWKLEKFGIFLFPNSFLFQRSSFHSSKLDQLAYLFFYPKVVRVSCETARSCQTWFESGALMED